MKKSKRCPRCNPNTLDPFYGLCDNCERDLEKAQQEIDAENARRQKEQEWLDAQRNHTAEVNSDENPF